MRSLEEVALAVEEIEALRLKDLEGLDQTDAAVRMNVSRPTFQRILVKARGKVAEALFHGKAIRIGGGDFHVANEYTPGAGDCRGRGKKTQVKLKIAVSTNGDNLTATVHEKFGRCLRFLVIDRATGETDLIDNAENVDGRNAGIKSAQRVIKYGVDTVLTGECGPKALGLLESAGIEVVTGVGGQIADVLAAYRAES